MDIDRVWDGFNYEDIPSELAFIVLIDTNVLLSHLTSVELVRAQSITRARQAMAHPVLLIPQIVMRELDGLKGQNRITTQNGGKSETVSTLARRAINWLLDRTDSDSAVDRLVLRGQRKDETLRPLKGGEDTTLINDDILLDIALYHRQRGRTVCLLSADHNLLVRARVEQIWSINPARLTPDLLLRELGLLAPEDSAHKVIDSTHGTSAQAISFTNGGAPATPPRPVPLMSSHDMQIDEAVEVPLSPGPMPDMLPVREPFDVLLNMALLFHHFVAPIVYRHLKFDAGITLSPADWRTWTADDVIYALRNNWNAFVSLVETGLVLVQGRSSTPPPATSTATLASPSRWSQQHGPLSHQDKSSLPSDESATAKTRKKRTADVERALPSLLQAFASIHSVSVADVSFTSARWLVVLESVQTVMSVLLSADRNEDVSDDVTHVVETWRAQLRGLHCIQ